MAYNSYRNNDIEINRRKKIKSIIWKIVFLLFFGIIFYFVFLNFTHKKVNKIIKADIEIETVKLKNAVENFKKRSGFYPELFGNENNLSNIKVDTQNSVNIDFTDYYGQEKIYEIPGNLKKGVAKSNKIVTIKDNKGGWVYNKTTGEIAPNIEDK